MNRKLIVRVKSRGLKKCTHSGLIPMILSGHGNCAYGREEDKEDGKEGKTHIGSYRTSLWGLGRAREVFIRTVDCCRYDEESSDVAADDGHFIETIIVWWA